MRPCYWLPVYYLAPLFPIRGLPCSNPSIHVHLQTQGALWGANARLNQTLLVLYIVDIPRSCCNVYYFILMSLPGDLWCWTELHAVGSWYGGVATGTGGIRSTLREAVGLLNEDLKQWPWYTLCTAYLCPIGISASRLYGCYAYV